MKATLNDVYTNARTLTEAEQAALIGRLLEELDGPADEGVEQAWFDEIERRLAAYDRGETQAIPAQEVHRRIRARRR